MKKTISLLLAVMLCGSLCACGSGNAESGRYDTLIGHIEANDYASAYAELNSLMGNTTLPYLIGVAAPADSEEDANATEIEITLDNWQDYFEFRDGVTVDYNAFDEMTSFHSSHKFGLKKELEGTVLSVDVAIEFAMSGVGCCRASYDDATGQLTFGERLTEEELDAVNIWFSEDSETKTANYSYDHDVSYYSAGSTESDPNSVSVYGAYWPSTLEISGTQGTVLAERYDTVEVTRIKGTVKVKAAE